VRKVLQQKNLADVLRFMRAVPHASGQNYVLGDPHGVIDLECSAHKVVEHARDERTGRVFHTNHPLANDDTASYSAMWARGERDAPHLIEQLKKRLTTFNRFAALQTEMGSEQALDVPRAAQILSDHTAPVCLHHLHQGNYTLGCLVMELEVEQPRLHIAGGPPCSTPFRAYTFSPRGS
jgi:hypothetical protein